MKTTAKLAQLARSGESDNMMALRAGPSQAAAAPRSLDTMSHSPHDVFPSKQQQTTILKTFISTMFNFKTEATPAELAYGDRVKAKVHHRVFMCDVPEQKESEKYWKYKV